MDGLRIARESSDISPRACAGRRCAMDDAPAQARYDVAGLYTHVVMAAHVPGPAAPELLPPCTATRVSVKSLG